jgi:replicative DNA helicase
VTFQKSSAVLAEFMKDFGDGIKEVSYAGGTFGDSLVLAPGKISVIGAPPGAGKTALASQAAFEALDRFPELTLHIANAEMEMRQLIIREFARRAGVSHSTIRSGMEAHSNDEANAVFEAFEKIAPVIKRTHHMVPPFSCEELGELALVSPPGILLVDYLQKFRSATVDSRAGVDEVVTCLRELALQGWAVLALSATTRGNGKKGGHDPDGLSLSSFKESGEIEFNADAAYVLRDKSDSHDAIKNIDLDCVKNRSGQHTLLELSFDGDLMRFERNEPEPFDEFLDHSQEQGNF